MHAANSKHRRTELNARTLSFFFDNTKYRHKTPTELWPRTVSQLLQCPSLVKNALFSLIHHIKSVTDGGKISKVGGVHCWGKLR